jgi:hypothetical protein
MLLTAFQHLETETPIPPSSDHVPGSTMMADTSSNAPESNPGASECRRKGAVGCNLDLKSG